MKLVYVVGGLLAPNGMSSILSAKINYLAEHTNYELYMILTEKAEQKWYYKINPKVQWVNFDVNFDELDTMPLYKKFFFYQLKQHKYKKLFTSYLMKVRPDITVSTVRREINFINDIPDGSKKVGEIHFNKSNYRNIHVPFFPESANRYLSKKWMEKLQRQIERLDRFVVLTYKDATNWIGLGNLEVIPNFITHFPSQVSTCTNEKVIAVGRYDRVKGFDMLIEAWKIVYKLYPNWCLNIYGSGNREQYQQKADGLGLRDVVHCNGPVSDIESKYAESSLFVLSSRNEGFGLVIVEAMAAGLPVVAFDCPCGPSDIIRNDKDGLLIDNGNIQALAMGICKLMEDQSLRKQYGANALVSCNRYSQATVMKQWIDLFEEVNG